MTDKKPEMAVSCQVEKGGRILSLLPKGTLLKKGDLVCELDASDLKDRLTDHNISVKRAESEHKIAQLSHEAAVRDLQEYEQSTYIQDKAAVQREIKNAESKLAVASDQVDEANKLSEQGNLSKARKIASELAYQETRFALELAQNRLSSLENFTKPNTFKRLRGEVVKALSREQTAAESETWNGARAEKTRLQMRTAGSSPHVMVAWLSPRRRPR